MPKNADMQSVCLDLENFLREKANLLRLEAVLRHELVFNTSKKGNEVSIKNAVYYPAVVIIRISKKQARLVDNTGTLSIKVKILLGKIVREFFKDSGVSVGWGKT